MSRKGTDTTGAMCHESGSQWVLGSEQDLLRILGVPDRSWLSSDLESIDGAERYQARGWNW